MINTEETNTESVFVDMVAIRLYRLIIENPDKLSKMHADCSFRVPDSIPKR